MELDASDEFNSCPSIIPPVKEQEQQRQEQQKRWQQQEKQQREQQQQEQQQHEQQQQEQQQQEQHIISCLFLPFPSYLAKMFVYIQLRTGHWNKGALQD